MTVREDSVRYPDGTEGIYSVVDAADVALVIPVDSDSLHLVEQYRHPSGRRSWEFPSGSLVSGDGDAVATARRELREETGLVAKSLTALGCIDISPSMTSHRCSIFLATDLERAAPERDAEEQGMSSAWFTRREVERMVGVGQISDSKSIAALGLLLLSGPASLT